MTAIAGPYLIVCAILGLGGVAKLVSPQPARRALHTLRVPAPIAAVRALGLAELALAVAAALVGGAILPPMVGAAYLAFAVFVVAMLRGGGATSCGCFGSSSTPPSWLHVAINLVSAAVAFAATSIPALGTTLSEQPGAGAPLIGLVVVGTYLSFVLLTLLPTVLAPPQPHISPFAIINETTR